MLNRIILLLAIAITSTAALAQKPSSMLTWKGVNGAWGYQVEIRNEAGNLLESKIITSTAFSVSFLKPGEYTFRISTVNKLRRIEGSTEWIKFSVERATVPSITGLSKNYLYNNRSNKDIIVNGSGFNDGTRFYLEKSGERKPLEADIINAEKAAIKYNPAENEFAHYNIIAVNPGNFPNPEKFSVDVLPAKAPLVKSMSPSNIFITSGPSVELTIKGEGFNKESEIIISGNGFTKTYKAEKNDQKRSSFTISTSDYKPGAYFLTVKNQDGLTTEAPYKFSAIERQNGLLNKNIYIAVFPSYNFILGSWSDYYQPSINSYGLSVSIPLTEKFSAEAEADYMTLEAKNIDSSVTNKFWNSSAAVGAGYKIASYRQNTNSSVDIFTHLIAGATYSSLKTSNALGSESLQSIDLLISASVSSRITFFQNFFLEPQLEARTYLYKSASLFDLRGSLKAGVRL